jgi:hypothetical protein
MARPTCFSADVLKQICDRLCEGEPMARICQDEGMPAARTVRSWMEGDVDSVPAEEVSAAIARARQEGFDALAAECLTIADATQGDVQRDKLRVWTRLELLKKWDPKRYGELLKLAGADGSSPIRSTVLTTEATPAQAAEVYTQFLG